MLAAMISQVFIQDVCTPVFSVLENLGCKVRVMGMMTHDDPNVRKEALLAVQKLMVHNW